MTRPIAVTPRQQQRIIDAAQAWLMAHPEHADFELRFDAVLIAPRRYRAIVAAFRRQHLKNLFPQSNLRTPNEIERRLQMGPHRAH